MCQWSIARRLAIALCLLALPVWAAEYRLQVVNLDYLTVSSYQRDGDLGHLKARLDSGEFPAGAVIPGREVQLLEGPGYGGPAPIRLAVLPTTKERAWTTLVWEGTPGEVVTFVVKTYMVAWQEVWSVAASAEGTLRRLLIGGPALFGHSARPVPAVSYHFIANAVDRGTFLSWVEQHATSLHGMSIVVGRGDHPVYSPDRVYTVITLPPEPRTFELVIGWRTRHERKHWFEIFPRF
jgi:hypothetical protein